MNHAKAGKTELLPATLVTLILAFVISGLAGLITMAVVFLLGWFLCNRLAKQLGGLTADTYGAVNESMAVAVLLVYFIISANLPKLICWNWGGFDWSSYCGWAAFWLW
ncbi:MAG: adenosylcobinamide-GDP ribazoletransferase, partial [Clostridia bacterium]|nr:adenosylcobinamide-GDP ribazoletransferase [Clostridia bacterium]